MRRRALASWVIAVLVSGLLVPAGAVPVPERSTSWGSEVPEDVEEQFDGKDHARYIVLLDDRADLSAATARSSREERRKAVVSALQETARSSQERILSILESARDSGAVSSYRSFWVTNAIGVASNEAVLRTIAGFPEVGEIVSDTRHPIIPSTPSEAQAAVETAAAWNVERVGAPGAWEMGIDGSGVVVANLDTGVDHTHQSLADTYRGADGSHDYDWWDAVAHEEEPYDDNSHGTHTMGTMVGGDGPGPDTNDIGVAPGARWVAAKAFDSGGSGFATWILEAAEFLSAPTKLDGSDPDPTLAPHVVNNSWGGGQCSPWFDDVLDTWRALDIFPAFAIGNSGPDEGSANSPGDSPKAFSAGATDYNDEIAFFSSRGPSCYQETKPEVSAPGVAVRSSVPQGGFDWYSGTSMAAPHIAGAVALVLQSSAHAMGVEDIERVLAETALDLGDEGPDNDYGAGRLQALDAVREAFNGGVLEGTVTESGTADPVPGAELSVDLSHADVRVFSSSDGAYRLWLPEGVHTVHVEAFAFAPTDLVVSVEEQETTTRDVALDRLPTAEISGQVLEEPSGDRAGGAVVRVLDTPLEPATADKHGRYSIEVPQGTYALRADFGNCHEPGRGEADASTSDTTLDLSVIRAFDGYGYVCDEGSFADEPGTDRLSLSGDDQSRRIDLPFPFPFYGERVEEAWVHTNGFVSFADVRTEWVNRGLPDPDEPNLAVYGLWDDLFVRGSERGVYTATYGEAPDRRFVIEYRNFELRWTGDLVNFAIVLEEDGDVEVRYGSLEGPGNGDSATVGVEGPHGASGLQYALDEPILEDRSAVRFEVGPFGAVEGRVTNAADGLGVEGAVVTLGERTTATLSDGTYRVAHVDGTYDLAVVAEGYPSDGRADVPVSLGEVTTADFSLPAPAVAAEPVELAFETAGNVETARVHLSNDGSMPLGFETRERTAEGLAQAVSDPEGDARDVDIVAIHGGIDEGSSAVDFRLDFSALTNMSEVVGYVHLDTDQDPETGRPPEDLYGKPEQDIGYDYFIDLWGLYWGYVDVYTDDFRWMGSADAEVVGQSASFSLPLSLLGEDDGRLDLTSAVGSWYEPTDWAPDSGHGSIPAYVDVPWLSSSPVADEVEGGGSAEIEVEVDPSDLEPGTHRADLVLFTNDPRRPTVAVSITLEDLPYRLGVNAGGDAFEDGSQDPWEADRPWLIVDDHGYIDPLPDGLLPGGASTTTATSSDVGGTEDDTLYGSQRIGTDTYRFRIPEAGTYTVELGFAEIAGAAPGERVFDVFVGDTLVLDDYDIAGAVGPLVADSHTLEVDASGPWLDVRFEGVEGDPAVNLLRVTLSPDPS